MNTNKAAYWIALGVLALGLNSQYRHGNFVALHRVADHAGSALCGIRTRAERTLAVARILASRQGLPVDDLLASAGGAEMARAQAEMLREQARDRAELLRDEIRDQADAIRAEAQMRRAEIMEIRSRTRTQLGVARRIDRRVELICPKTGARVVVNAEDEDAGVSPVDVEDSDQI
jgi:hypothetical protein